MEFDLKLHYFTAQTCSVCDSLLPKIKSMLNQNFPQILLEVHSIEEQPKITAEFGVFTVPVALFTIDGKESERWVRSFGVVEIEEKLKRIITLINE